MVFLSPWEAVEAPTITSCWPRYPGIVFQVLHSPCLSVSSSPPHLQGLCSKTPMDAWNHGWYRTLYILCFFAVNTPFHLKEYFIASLSELPASLPLCFVAIIKKWGILEHKHCHTVTVNLISKRATKWLVDGEHMQRGHTLDKGMIQVLDRMELDVLKFHQVTQNGAQFKTWIVYFWNFPCDVFRPWLTSGTETLESETIYKGGQVHIAFHDNLWHLLYAYTIYTYVHYFTYVCVYIYNTYVFVFFIYIGTSHTMYIMIKNYSKKPSTHTCIKKRKNTVRFFKFYV